MLHQLTNKFLHRVRIHGGEFDSSARAMNRVEESNFFQADLRKFRGSTFERKQMSTTIKRIALVAVAALGLGVVSVAPSQAVTQADSLTLSSATASQLTGETLTAGSATASVSFLGGSTADTYTVSAFLFSAPAGNTATPALSLVETTSALVAASAPVSNVAAGTALGQVAYISPAANTSAVTAKFNVYLTGTTKAGTYVVKLAPAILSGGGTASATTQTLTITVTANPATDTVAASATSYITAGETYTATYAEADEVVTSTRTAASPNDVAAAVIRVGLLNAAGKATNAESFTATITGPGVLAQTAFSASGIGSTAAQGRSLLVVNGNAVAVFPDGTSGVATITISSAAGLVLATEKVTFFGDAATISATVAKAVIGAADTSKVLTVTVKDSAGVAVSNLANKIGVVSSDTTKISTLYTPTSTYDAATGTYSVNVTGVAVGSSNLTVTTKSSATATTGVDASAAVAVRVGSLLPASVKVSTDKASYAPGEKGSLKVELFDKDGLEVVAGETYTAIFDSTGIVSSYALQNSDATTFASGITSYVSGGRLYTFYAPVTEGDVKFSWTTGTTASGTRQGLATANQAKEGSVTVAVSSVATSAAIDAANEASQAASDATDAALAAADAADEATTKAQEAVDAVATLSAEVTKMINALKAQIKTLSNLVTKIAKKVRA